MPALAVRWYRRRVPLPDISSFLLPDDARWRATLLGWRTSLISASSVDTELTLLYWRVGCRIGREVLEGTGFVIGSAMYGRTRASRV